MINIRKYNKWREEEDKKLGVSSEPDETSPREWLEDMVKQGSNYACELLAKLKNEDPGVLIKQMLPEELINTAATRTVANVSSPPACPVIPLPSQAAHTHSSFKAPPVPRLHLSTLPPVPVFTNGAATTPGSAGSPSAITPSMVQSPPVLLHGSSSTSAINSSIFAPSPIKKKLSLGDYMSRRMATTPATEKSQSQALGDSPSERETDPNRKFSVGGVDSPSENTPSKSDTGVVEQGANDGGADDTTAIADDLSMKDEDEGEYSPPDASPPHVDSPSMLPASGTVSYAPEVANVLAQLAQFKQPVDKMRAESAGSNS